MVSVICGLVLAQVCGGGVCVPRESLVDVTAGVSVERPADAGGDVRVRRHRSVDVSVRTRRALLRNREARVAVRVEGRRERPRRR